MKYVRLIAKENTWFKAGSEVFDYNSDYFKGQHVTLAYWQECLRDGAICVRGIRANGEEDGESCLCSEFEVEVIDE
jgi:hypothetical protein